MPLLVRTVFAQPATPARKTASELVSVALERARVEKKVVWIDFSAVTWCMPCRRLERFLAAPETKGIIESHYVVLPIVVLDGALDTPGGVALHRRFGGTGVPFSVFLDSTGARLVHGGPAYPVTPAAIATWKGTFERTAQRMTTAERATLVEYLVANANGPASIRGTVANKDGAPLPGISVSLVTNTYSEGRWKPGIGAMGKTNAQGIYEFVNVTPGDYRLVASAPPPGADSGGLRQGTRVPIFAPGTPSFASATVRTVARSEDAADFDLRLVDVATARVRGIVVGSGDRPLANIPVAITDAEWPLAVYRGTTGADGSFSISGVRPGRYDVRARLPATSQTATEMGWTSVAVPAAGLDDVRIIASRGTTVTGRLVVDGPPLPAGDRSAVTITAIALPRPGAPGGNPQVAVQDDGGFALRGLFGPRVIRVLDLPAGWTIVSVSRDGKDITDTPVDLGSIERIDDVQVVITSRTSTISGNVANANSAGPKPAAVIVFAERSQRWSYPSRHVRAVPIDPQGRFTIVGLPAGHYLIAAVESLPHAWDSPESLERLRADAATFELRDGERKVVVVANSRGAK